MTALADIRQPVSLADLALLLQARIKAERERRFLLSIGLKP